MDNLFLLLFLASIVCLIIGLIKPSVFSRFSKKTNTRKKVGLVFALSALVFFIAFGFTIDTEPKTTPQPDKSTQQSKTEEPKEEISTYELKIEANATGGDTIEVKGTSNLPDGSIVSVVINRISVWQGEDEERFFRNGFANLKVQDKKFGDKIKVDDQKFLDFEKASGEIIKSLDENVEVVVNFDPSSELQPKGVVDKIGKSGEKLENSPQKSVFGSLTDTPVNQLEVELRTKLIFPFQNELPKS